MRHQPVHDCSERSGYRGGGVAWSRFLVAVLLLLGVVILLSQGYTPPGPAGEVFRNNLRHGIDATPLFYTEVEGD